VSFFPEIVKKSRLSMLAATAKFNFNHNKSANGRGIHKVFLYTEFNVFCFAEFRAIKSHMAQPKEVIYSTILFWIS
jgi:hypothetical protein